VTEGGAEKLICGIDEAGRGPLAGPVYAAAAALPPDFPREILADSKRLSEERREEAALVIRERALAWGLGCASHEEIDELNILRASLLAMRRAWEAWLEARWQVAGGRLRNVEIIVDGLYVPELEAPPGLRLNCRAMVKADAAVAEVMAASILAKTARDAEMRRMAALYPAYGYERHKGYPTKAHRTAIARYGPSPIQRLTFRVKP